MTMAPGAEKVNDANQEATASYLKLNEKESASNHVQEQHSLVFYTFSLRIINPNCITT